MPTPHTVEEISLEVESLRQYFDWDENSEQVSSLKESFKRLLSSRDAYLRGVVEKQPRAMLPDSYSEDDDIISKSDLLADLTR
jgi:hypothetical protein